VRYEKADWLDTAEVLLRQAAKLNPELAREPLERLRAQKNELRLARKETVGEAVDMALDWLARHQQPDKGHWDGDDFYQLCQGKPCTGKAYPLYDPGLTGLAVLAFLGKGHTHQEGRYKDVLTRAFDYLKRVQDPDGCFGAQTGHFTYNHCIATLALAEALQKTNDSTLRHFVEHGVAFLLKAQHREPSTGNRLGWRYEVHPKDNDTSVTGWAVRALLAARAAGVKVPDAALDGALAWIDRMIDPETGRVGYASQGVSPARQSVKTAEKWPPKLSEAITAIGIVARCQLGKNAKDDMVTRGIGLCMERLPDWNEKSGAVDMYYWYYGTQALKLAGGDRFPTWFNALKRALIFHQRQDGCSRGSWDPVGPWGSEGGRIYSTALMALALEDGLDGSGG
jgi:squalene-hopene cyclase-like protein